MEKETLGHPAGRTHPVETPLQEVNKIDLRSEIQEDFGRHPIPWAEWVFDALDFPTRARILELGSGSGRLWQQNRAEIPPGWRITLSDVTPETVAQARQALTRPAGKPTSHFRFLGLDAQALPFTDNRFDAVLALGVLDLVPDIRQALSEVHRVLRPRGQFVVSVGGRGHLREMEDLLAPFIPSRQAAQLGGDETRFGLENGAKWLGAFFTHVTRLDYRDQMIFTELQPILEYALSEPLVLEALTLSTLAQLTRTLKRELARRGEIKVTIYKGLFIARNKI